MAAGERAVFFLGPVPEDKLPKDATPGGEGGRCLPVRVLRSLLLPAAVAIAVPLLPALTLAYALPSAPLPAAPCPQAACWWAA